MQSIAPQREERKRNGYTYLRLVYGLEALKQQSHRAVLAALAFHADREGYAYPGIELLAKEAQLDVRSVKRSIDYLGREGLVTVERRSVGRLRKGNSYTLNFAALLQRQRSNAPSRGMVSPDEVTYAHREVTCATASGDIKSISNRKNSHEQPEEQSNEHTARKRGLDREGKPLPDWIDAETWNGYVEMREATRGALSERTRDFVLQDLGCLRDEGSNPNEVLNEALMRGYTGPLTGWK